MNYELLEIFRVDLFAGVRVDGPSKCGGINFPPIGNNFQNVAANVPASGNLWTGLAESFTAQDAKVLFGFYVGNYTPSAVSNSPLVFSLYAGDGLFSNLLVQKTANVSLASFSSQLVQVDFSSISLMPGNQYTVVASLPTANQPTLGNYSDLSALYNSNSINANPGGRFYFVGSSYNASFPDRTLAFNVTPVTPAGASATFLPLDKTTQGSWTGTYGGGGYIIANDASTAPSYATVTSAGSGSWTWANPTSDPRALQTASGASTRIASTFYSTGNSFNINLNLTDSNGHRVALYLLDWDATGRAETISILDAATNAVLDKETFSNFQNGQYAVWNLSGNVIIQITRTSGNNAVVGGIFFDVASSGTSTPGSASYIGEDTTTQGAWTAKCGADGDFIANYANKSPSYGTVNLTGDRVWTWANPTNDPKALTTTGGNAIASAYYGSSFAFNVNLTDGNTHPISLYLLDWDSTSRAETISIFDANTNTLLDKQTFGNFHNGVYASWNIKGNVIIEVTGTAGINAVVSGLFFGPAPNVVPTTASASYSGLDKTTQGRWTGQYGTSGYEIPNDIDALPSFASVFLTGTLTWTWSTSASDMRDLQSSYSASSRIASAFYSTAGSFNINLNLADGKSHRIALYLLDWDTAARVETITISDAASHVVLSTQSFSSFQNGQYAIWNIKGNVNIQVTDEAGINAVVSGIFVD